MKKEERKWTRSITFCYCFQNQNIFLTVNLINLAFWISILMHMKSEAFLNLMNSPWAQSTKICSVHMCRLRDYAHSIWSQCFFWYFCPKNGSKRPQNGPKMSWVWFGLVGLGQFVILGHGWHWNSFQIVQNSKVESQISSSLWGTLKLTTRGNLNCWFQFRPVGFTT